MLSKEEELRLEACVDLLKNGHITSAEGVEVKTQLWLAEKLKEINEECSKITEELQSANETLANMYSNDYDERYR
jgi:hypothetical protein